jgi:hypothetical protein
MISERLKADRKKPKLTFQTLVHAVNTRVPWGNEWLNNVKSNSYIEKSGYTEFTRLLYSSMYTTVVQGRPLALSTLTVADGNELISMGVILSNQFKTNDKYGYQPVTVKDSSLELLKAYVEIVRPLIVDQSQSLLENGLDNSSLFLKFDGLPLIDLGREVTRFFKSKIGCHVTTISIRSLVETESENLRLKGLITEGERRAVQNVNGHSGKTATDYYVRNDRVSDAILSHNVFERMVNPVRQASIVPELTTSTTVPIMAPPNAQEWEVTPILSHAIDLTMVPFELAWGSAHPNFGQKVGRAVWTDLEVRTIGEWCTQKISETPALRKQIVKHCHQFLITTGRTSYGHIFHQLHIEDATRLRHGHRIAAKMQEYALLNDPSLL